MTQKVLSRQREQLARINEVLGTQGMNVRWAKRAGSCLWNVGQVCHRRESILSAPAFRVTPLQCGDQDLEASTPQVVDNMSPAFALPRPRQLAGIGQSCTRGSSGTSYMTDLEQYSCLFFIYRHVNTTHREI